MSDLREVVGRVLSEHDGVNSTAAWEGSPDSTNPRNVRRVCKCGAIIGWHDRSKQRDGQWYPLSGYPFDEPHRAHVTDELTTLLAAHPDAPEGETREEWGSLLSRLDWRQIADNRVSVDLIALRDLLDLGHRTLRVGPWVEVES